MIIEEDPGRIQLSPYLDEPISQGIPVDQLLAIQEVELSPVHPRAEIAEQAVNVVQISPIVRAGRLRYGDRYRVLLIAMRKMSAVPSDRAHFHREYRCREAVQHQLAHRRH